MDNLTHTLIGALIGETAAQTTAPDPSGLPQQQRRNLYVWLTAIGSNLPDTDVLRSLFVDGKLDYLLHHRGLTHTVPGALLLAAMLLLAGELWCRWRRWRLSNADRLQLAGLAALALLLHVTMDFTNNYGVHPFWPFYDGWLYGDILFIWEPLLWSAAAPLAFTLKTRTARTLVLLLLAAAIALCIGSGLVPVISVAALVLLTGAMLLIGFRAARRTALLAGIALWLSVTAVFAMSRHVVDGRIADFTARQFPGLVTLDRALSPNPVNPVCWEVTLALADRHHYLARSATWSLAPSWMPARQCVHLARAPTAPLVPMQAPDTAFVQWHGEVAMPRNEIAQLAAGNCEAAAFMRFARIPWMHRTADGWIIGDLRYDRESDLGFAELALGQTTARCSTRMPPWVPPRLELLHSAE